MSVRGSEGANTSAALFPPRFSEASRGNRAIPAAACRAVPRGAVIQRNGSDPIKRALTFVRVRLSFENPVAVVVCYEANVVTQRVTLDRLLSCIVFTFPRGSAGGVR
ncbi:hypothetical protein MTO96_048554 [Rhipicephalus appendiculatus]